MFRGVKSVLKSVLLRDSASTTQQHHQLVIGYYNIAGRRDLRTKQRVFYACGAERVTAYSMSLTVPVIGDVGESITVQFDQFGELKGSIATVMDRGFNFNIEANDEDRAKLAGKIDWFEKSLREEVSDVRVHGRMVPREPLSTLVFADGSTARCFIIDMSGSGAAVSAGVVPDLGTPLAVGKLVGRVVRHFHGGFAVEFIGDQEPKSLERLLLKPSLAAVPGRTRVRP